MSALNNVCEIPLASNVIPEYFRFKRPMYNVNYDSLDGIGLLGFGYTYYHCPDGSATDSMSNQSVVEPNSKYTEKKDFFSEHIETDFAEYVLHIFDIDRNRVYKMCVAADKRILDIKTDMYTCSDVKVSQQTWTGWPASCTSDDLMVSELGLTEPELHLSFRATSLPASTQQTEQVRPSICVFYRLLSIRIYT